MVEKDIIENEEFDWEKQDAQNYRSMGIIISRTQHHRTAARGRKGQKRP
jgi:hypothetical protein